jgi:two-component system response regulator DevR
VADMDGALVTRLRVMLVDDHEIVRSGITAMLAATDDLRVIAEAETVQEAVREAERTRPDVVVMDIRLADGSGIEATREIRDRFPDTKVLMLTSFADDEALYASIMAGAAGYVLKQIKGGDLVRGIRTVGAGQSLLDPAITRLVLDRLRRGKHLKDEKLALLSAQEEKILALVAEGMTNSQIGTELFLAEKTVKNYVSSILGKLEVVRRAEAAAYLARHSATPGGGDPLACGGEASRCPGFHRGTIARTAVPCPCRPWSIVSTPPSAAARARMLFRPWPAT